MGPWSAVRGGHFAPAEAINVRHIQLQPRVAKLGCEESGQTIWQLKPSTKPWKTTELLEHHFLVGGFNHHVEKCEFVNGKDDIPYMKWKIKAMFETTNQIAIMFHITINP